MKQCTITQLEIASSLTLLAMTESLFGVGFLNSGVFGLGSSVSPVNCSHTIPTSRSSRRP